MMSVSTASPAVAPSGSVKLTGTVIGTAGSYNNQGNTIANVFDGNTATFFDAPTASGGWAGLDLGSAKAVTQLQFVPRTGFTSRMVGGVFQGSNTADFSSGVTTLFTVTAQPTASKYTAAPVTASGTFRYVRYLAPANAYGDVAEVEVDGVANTPTAVPTAPTAVAATVSPTAVHLSWREDAASVANTFTIQRKGPTDAAYVSIGTTTGSVTNFDDVTAATATSYSYVVLATNLIGVSPASVAVSVATPTPVVSLWTDTDIGAPGKSGSSVVNTNGSITVSGGGADIWNQTDQFNYSYQAMAGNGSVVGQVTSQTNTNGSAKSGLMIRESTNADSRYVIIALTPSSGVVMEGRTATHSTPTFHASVAGKAGVWLQLLRNGASISGYASTDGVNWKLVGTVNVPLVNNVCAGLAVTAHDNTKLGTATFANVSINVTGTAAATWSDAATAPISRWEAQNVTYNGKLYTFGGFIDRNLDATAECDVYDPRTNTWQRLSNIPTGGLTHAAVTVVGDTAYFAGGDLGTFSHGAKLTSTAAVLSYNMDTGTWGTLTSLPAPGSCGGLVCINNQLFYYGGLNATDKADLSNTWALDLANPSAGWVAKAAMPDARDHIGAVAINGIAYAVAGGHLYNQTQGNDAEVDAYNPVTDTWTRVASFPVPNSSIETSTLVVNGKIVVVGGQTNGGFDGIYLNTVQTYDPSTDQWTQAATLPEASQSSAAGFINGQLIVVGGTVDNQGGWAQNQTWVLPDFEA